MARCGAERGLPVRTGPGGSRGLVSPGAIAVSALAGPVLGVATGAATLGILAHHARSNREFRRALALASAGRRDEALTAVQALEARHLGEQFPPFIDYLT